jgi:membrane protein required for colicin V production
MNYVDLGVLIVVGISALLGLSRGFVREVLGIAAWGLAAWAAYQFGGVLVPHVAKILGNEALLNTGVAYAAVFIACLIAASIAANLVGRLVRLSLVSGLDRTLGMAFGAARGAVLAIAVYILGGIAVPPDQWPPIVKVARSLPALHDGADMVTGFLPAKFRPIIAAPPAERAASVKELLRAIPTGSALSAKDKSK